MIVKTVKLVGSVPGSKGTLRELKFREPRYDDYIANGDCEAYIRTAEGSVWRQDNHKVIDEYARLLLQDEDANLLSLLSLTDTFKVTELIKGFFHEAMTEAIPSAALPATSSSSASSTPATSAQ